MPHGCTRLHLWNFTSFAPCHAPSRCDCTFVPTTALRQVRPGVAWRDVEVVVRRLLLEQLLQLGLVRGSVDELLDAKIDRVGIQD